MTDLGITTNACKVCRAPNRRRLIEADWADGMTATGIAKTMTDAGWKVSPETILKHLKEHAGPGASVRAPVTVAKRDAAIFVRDRMMDELERREAKARREAEELGEEPDEAFSLLSKDLQPALGTMLKAQGELDKRDRSKEKQQVGLLLLMLGVDPSGGGPGPLAPLELTAGEDESDIIIEGAFREA